MLKGKTIILGVTGSIAAYKIANLASSLVKLHADVHVIMTKNACNFINPITFETLTNNKCLTDTFDRNFEFNVEHVSLAKKADLVLIAPASANIIGKLANGICDDMLTTTVFASKCPKLLSPAMNTNMYLNPILQDNLEKLKHYGFNIIEPASGYLACGDTGVGKMVEPEILLEHIMLYVALPHDLVGKKILITAGPTREFLDPVRFITNRSTGKMGYALAKMAKLRGADVTLVSGPVNLKEYTGIKKVDIISALDMYNTIKDIYKDYDYIIMSAAVADYTYDDIKTDKIKKSEGNLELSLIRTNDILDFLGHNKVNNQKIIGFSMETKDLEENSKKKLDKKNADMICANSIKSNKTGFGVDTNEMILYTKNNVVKLELDLKENIASKILDEIIKL